MADLTDYCSCVLELSGCGWAPTAPTYPPTEQKWLAIAYAVCVFCVVAFAVYAVIVYTLYMRKMHRDQTTEEFCTAKGTQVRRAIWNSCPSCEQSWCDAAQHHIAALFWAHIHSHMQCETASMLPSLRPLSLCIPVYAERRAAALAPPTHVQKRDSHQAVPLPPVLYRAAGASATHSSRRPSAHGALRRRPTLPSTMASSAS